MRGEDAQGNAMPMQGASERSLRTAWWPINRPEDCRREGTGGKEPAAMLSEVTFPNILRARVLGFGALHARPSDEVQRGRGLFAVLCQSRRRRGGDFRKC